MSSRFKGWKVAVLAGDRRQLEIIRQFHLAGAKVSTYGCPKSEDAELEGLRVESAVEAVRGARLIALPIPGFLKENQLYSPFSDETIFVDHELLHHAADSAYLFTGRMPSSVQAAAMERGLVPVGLGSDDILQVHHAIPTAEGALQITIAETDHTIHNATALVIGYGRVAVSLARALAALGARVSVAARRPEVLVRAFADGYQPVGMDEIESAITGMDLIYNTAPAMMLPRNLLALVKPGALVMDLASPPGGVDFDAAKALGVRVNWARGQAGSAPTYAGWSQFKAIEGWLDREEPAK